MEESAALQLTVRRLARLIRQRRAAFYGLRGLAWGLTAAVVPVLLRSLIGPWALPLAGAIAGVGLLAGLLYGVCLRVSPSDAARLADRQFGLHDRPATALELLRLRDQAPLALSAVRDAASRTPGLDLRRAVPWRWPRELRFVPVPILALAALPYLPPLPVPDELFPPFQTAEEKEKKEE